MIPILLLDLTGVILVIGYVYLDRRQNGSHGLPNPESTEHLVRTDQLMMTEQLGPVEARSSLPVEPIIAQRSLPSDVKPRRIRRPSPMLDQPSANSTSRSDEA